MILSRVINRLFNSEMQSSPPPRVQAPGSTTRVRPVRSRASPASRDRAQRQISPRSESRRSSLPASRSVERSKLPRRSAATGCAEDAAAAPSGRHLGCCRGNISISSGRSRRQSRRKEELRNLRQRWLRYPRGRGRQRAENIRIHLQQALVDLPRAAEDQPVDAIRMPRRQNLRDRATWRGFPST